jgi:hypothetical protein
VNIPFFEAPLTWTLLDADNSRIASVRTENHNLDGIIAASCCHASWWIGNNLSLSEGDSDIRDSALWDISASSVTQPFQTSVALAS